MSNNQTGGPGANVTEQTDPLNPQNQNSAPQNLNPQNPAPQNQNPQNQNPQNQNPAPQQTVPEQPVNDSTVRAIDGEEEEEEENLQQKQNAQAPKPKPKPEEDDKPRDPTLSGDAVIDAAIRISEMNKGDVLKGLGIMAWEGVKSVADTVKKVGDTLDKIDDKLNNMFSSNEPDNNQNQNQNQNQQMRDPSPRSNSPAQQIAADQQFNQAGAQHNNGARPTSTEPTPDNQRRLTNPNG